MAGVASVKNMVTTQKSGAEFLASSHFSISQDPAAILPSMQTTFRKDYIPHNTTSKPGAAIPPAPAGLMHQDARFFNEKASETVKSYQYTSMTKPKLENAQETLQRTNFKMDRDLSKFEAFHTTNNLYYPPRQGSSFSMAKPAQNPMKSNVPQGDIEKAPQPMSDYRDRYRGHDTRKFQIEKAPSQHIGGPATILGDNRLHHYRPTHGDVFTGTFLPKLPAYPAPVGTNIPQGDQEKEATYQSTMQQSYPTQNGERQPYSKQAVQEMLQHTHFRLDDGHKTWDTYQSTQEDSYKVKPMSMDRFKPDRHRNQSDLPEGDTNPGRIADRINMTTSRYYHGQYPYGFSNPVVSGANKRTESNVWFGEPRMNSGFYDTTMGDEFSPKNVPYSYNRSNFHTQSAIPVNYYGNELTNPTYYSDYQDPKQKRMIPDPKAVDNLRETHIKPPLKGERDFITTHNIQFIPKKMEKQVLVDSGKLQRSSVPLGTLNV
ncbi:testis-expressed protein 45 [Lingula anatina]|uniref:Testis-expressed protein 45 n=1 Tax=Lingula anatina TaxID=7574 RepID=A0A1S3H3R9_LINAN|nr:testis-expressed protein 45 [Lingula anatina]|eukprot:XP_013379784.1 testis-expressed protein 45 [Lingula anatina]